MTTEPIYFDKASERRQHYQVQFPLTEDQQQAIRRAYRERKSRRILESLVRVHAQKVEV